ncbi:polysaccharide biosynthesis C-terminal domain-containing protein [Marinomonas sp. GJ51-6]|nr:polysaccharide biosynthesis C-terminal domain-containing protein [Marinomonas sp. GJ51-6]WOD07783.1 polysaccharide biosynthesis C-terminal domain-containing protein [Marinomonas sp. GJ51-6]
MASGWVTNLGFSSMALVSLFLLAEVIVTRITDNAVVASEAIDYIYISLLLLVFSSASSVVVCYFNANKKTRIPLYGFMIEIPFNVVCSAVLIHGLWGAPEMGLEGAALGSVAAIGIRFFTLPIDFSKKKAR